MKKIEKENKRLRRAASDLVVIAPEAVQLPSSFTLIIPVASPLELPPDRPAGACSPNNPSGLKALTGHTGNGFAFETESAVRAHTLYQHRGPFNSDGWLILINKPSSDSCQTTLTEPHASSAPERLRCPDFA